MLRFKVSCALLSQVSHQFHGRLSVHSLRACCELPRPLRAPAVVLEGWAGGDLRFSLDPGAERVLRGWLDGVQDVHGGLQAVAEHEAPRHGEAGLGGLAAGVRSRRKDNVRYLNKK